MNIRVLQHSSISTLGTIEEYSKTKNHRFESTAFILGQRNYLAATKELMFLVLDKFEKMI